MMHRRKRNQRSKKLAGVIVRVLVACALHNAALIASQSVGYHPNTNIGFNPYNSAVYGYGLGVPYGAYEGISPLRGPWHMGLGTELKTPLAGKLHAKAIMKHMPNMYLGPAANLKNKFAVLKNPQFAYNPYAVDYGYGKHYGAAAVPNNPYKSTFADYYTTGTGDNHGDHLVSAGSSESVAIDNNIAPVYDQDALALQHHMKMRHKFKSLLKVGAVLTTAALLGKAKGELMPPMHLNPSGMILSGSSKHKLFSL